MKKQHTKFYLDAKKIWGTIVKVEADCPDELKLQLELHKKLLNIFRPGNHYYLLFDLYNGEVANITDDVITVLGFEPGEITAELLMNRIHPDDKPWFIYFEDKVTSSLLRRVSQRGLVGLNEIHRG